MGSITNKSWGCRNESVVRELASHHCGISLILALCHVWVGFFCWFLPFSEVFPLSFLIFLSAKTSVSKFNFNHDRGPIRKQAKVDVAKYCNISKAVMPPCYGFCIEVQLQLILM